MAAGATEDVELAILALPKKSFHCAACLCPLKPPVFRCENEHFVCQACGGNSVDGGGANKHCGPCGREVSYTRSRFMDGVVDAYKVPCLYKGHGCAMDDIPYHSAADHKASCKHAPCYCFDCRFVGSPAKLVRHLASPSGAHAWPVEKIKGNADADADAKPLYTGVLWVDGPPAPPRQPLGCSFRLKATVASCSVPGVVDMDQGWLHAHVSPNMLHGHGGESGDCELHLRLCLTKLA
ncbi:E3 ubiquitin-protein ligase SINA-like 5 [Triticum urartu]|uniref:E3 ubiquitin-protein ligase SINA-like 5 n=1 Tax=Triticum urartu TaxID=4572 RepID=M7ZMQ0_TRIUA|nr:E3 ubiquitin-protein ligase SINA-like 5 [Triticum urartu]